MTRTTPLRRMTLHFSQIFLTLGRTFISCLVELELFLDASARRVVFENVNDDGIPFEQPDNSVSRLVVQPRPERPPVVQADSKQGLGHYFVDDTRLVAVVARGDSFSCSGT